MKLYILCDKTMLKSRDLSIDDCIERAKELKASIVQYRNKSGSLSEIERDLEHLRAIWHNTLIVNDHIDFAHMCDGLHIGQEDLKLYGDTPKESISTIRERLENRAILGLSTHNRDEIIDANQLEIDYIGLGAYRSTSTKGEANILEEDPDFLAEISKHPIALIGGVQLSDRFQNIKYLVIGSGLYE